jgi:hypothetical protein
VYLTWPIGEQDGKQTAPRRNEINYSIIQTEESATDGEIRGKDNTKGIAAVAMALAKKEEAAAASK